MATNIDLIQQLYVAYFNRPADVAGLNYWTNALANGATVASIAADFSTQSEYTDLFAGKTADEIVNIIYTNLFGRSAEQAGLDYWGAKLQAGLVTVADVVTQVAAGATGSDLTAYNNKVTASEAFTTALSTSGNEAARVAYAGGTDAALDVAKAWLSTVTTDATLATAVAGVSTVTADVTAAGTPSVNATLTSSVDTLVGTAGNDVYSATFNGTGNAATTWTALDSIDGKGGVNTINLTDTAGGVDLSVATISNIQKLNVTSIGALDSDSADVSGWTSLTNATFSLKSSTAQTVIAGDTTAVTVTNRDTAGGVTIEGGSSINVTAGAGAVTATTNAALVSATIVGGTTVDITDASTDADKLTTVSLKGNTGLATLTGDALVNVSVTNTTSADVTIVNGADHTETLTLNNVATATITDAGATAVVLNTATKASKAVTLVAAAAESISIAAAVDLGLTALTAAAATEVIITGAGKVTVAAQTLDADAVIDASAATGAVTFSSVLGDDVLYTGGSGVDTITVGASTQKITTGAGNDVVTITGPLGTGGTVNAGEGTDTLAGTSAVVSALTATQAGKFTNFETLKITDVLADTASFDVSGFSGVTNFTAGNGVANLGTASVVGLGAGATVTLAGDLATNDGTLEIGTKTDGTADVVNLVLNASYLGGNNTSADVIATLTETVVATTAIETLNVTSTGTNTFSGTAVTGYKADTVINTLVLTDTGLVTLNVTGDQAFVFTSAAGSTKLATIDASALTAGATIDASAALVTSASLTIKGSLTASNTLTGGAAKDIIVGGAKADVITGGAKGDTLTGNGGNDTFKFAAGDSSIGTGAFDTITDFVANTYGNGTDGAEGTGATATASKLTGDILSFAAFGSGAGGVIVDVLTSASDATTYLANHQGTANTVVAALDSTNNNLYVDNTGDGVADFFIHLTGVTTITAAAFTVV